MAEWALLSATGLAGRITADAPPSRPAGGPVRRSDHDIVVSAAAFDPAGAVGAVTDQGRAFRLGPGQLPALPAAAAPSLAAGPRLDAVLGLGPGERAVAFFALDPDAPPLALGTAGGVVKRVVPDYRGWEEWAVIALKDGDRVVGAGPAAEADEVVFVASDAQLLRCPARAVRPQGRQAGGMAGLKLAPAASVIAFAAVPRGRQDDTVVATAAGTADPRRPVDWSVKVTPLAAFPAKGRATGGVRCHRFLKGQDALVLASVGPAPALACDQAGEPRNLPAADLRRDGSGSVLGARLFALG